MFNAKGKLASIQASAYHWMAIDEKGHFSNAKPLGDFDGGTFERITPTGAVPALLISSDFPIAIGGDGGLYYVPYKKTGRRELIRRMPDGQRTVFAELPPETRSKPMQWVNGIAAAADGSLYFTDDDAVGRVDPDGKVSTVWDASGVKDCADPLADVPELPYLRGLAVAPDGTLYVAASGCRSVMAISPAGTVKKILNAERPWSPTGLALSGKDIYVLEYLHTPGDDRKQWLPRVRKVTPDGKVRTLVRIVRPND